MLKTVQELVVFEQLMRTRENSINVIILNSWVSQHVEDAQLIIQKKI